MTRVVVDPKTGEKLRALRDTVELCDEQGQVLGEFRPMIARPLAVGIDSPLSEEEIQRREEEEGGRTLAEILADLEKLA